MKQFDFNLISGNNLMKAVEMMMITETNLRTLLAKLVFISVIGKVCIVII